jgi:hypothetical protein
MMPGSFYRVEVWDGAGQVVAIEPRMLAGRDIGERERNAIQAAIDRLCAFSGLSPSALLASRERRQETEPAPEKALSARWQELFWALPPGPMRSKLRSLEIDIGRALRLSPSAREATKDGSVLLPPEGKSK